MPTKLKKILIFIGALCALDTLILAVTANLFKAVVMGALTCAIFGFAFFRDKIMAFLRSKWGKITLCVIIFGIICLVTGVVSLHLYGSNDNVTYHEDAVIILGAGIKGERLSLTLKYRLDKGLEYIALNPNAKIIVTGGKGPGESITEAEAMRRYLVSQGIENDRIIIEDKATSTYENLMYSSEFLNEGDEVVIVTDGFHIFRGVSMAKKFGLEPTHLHSKSYIPQLPLNFIRELAAVMKMFVLGK
ncbi:MAG: YdcF family protein [Clostridia bacterium]|nr:YdcF family protein [Clostridia bacterium]